MQSALRSTVGDLIAKLSHGDSAALDAILPLIYDELHTLAEHYLRAERPDHTLQPTALVHEVYVRLHRYPEMTYRNRAHFVAVAAKLMRQVLARHARTRRADKRGHRFQSVELRDDIVMSQPNRVDIEALDEALTNLASLDSRQCDIVELRFFGGLTIEEIADVLGISRATVSREWTLARAWLHREISKC